MKNRTFWEQLFPRILALGIVGYLIYYLGIKGDALNIFHIVMLVIMLALVLAPMARKLKIFNIVDFDSKFNALQEEQQETKAQIGEMANKISNIIDVQIKPSQNQTNIINLGDMEEFLKELKSPKQLDTPTPTKDKGDSEQDRIDFLSSAEIHRGRTFTVLVIAREFQEAILEHKALSAKVVIGDTLDDKIRHMSKALIDRDVSVLFPFNILKGEVDAVPDIVSDITNGLQCVDEFLNIRQKVENREIAVPSNADELLENITEAVLNIKGAVIVSGSTAIVTNYNVKNKVNQLLDAVDAEIDEETTKSDNIN